MQLTNQQIGGIIFLCLSLFYGYFTFDIHLFPGAEFEPFTPRTLPQLLSVAGIVCAGLMITLGGSDSRVSLQGLNWKPTLALLGGMFIYGLLVSWLGFVLATIAFLGCAFQMMGEHNRVRAWLVAAVFSLLFWALLTQALGIYLEPGKLWHLLQPA